MSLCLRLFLAIFILLLCAISKNEVVEAKLAKFLRYDVECPFLSEEEFAIRLAEGRCEQTTTVQPASSSTTTEAPFSETKRGNKLSKGAKKLLLKFVFLGKKRSIKLDLSEHVEEYQVVEGVFVELRCPGSARKTGINQLDIKGALHLSPVLVNSDDGRFECFLNDDWKGSVRLKVDTTMNTIWAGYTNFLIGSAFSLLFLMCFLVLSCIWPEISENGSTKKFLCISLSKDDEAVKDELDFQEWLLFQVPNNNNKEVKVDIPATTPSTVVSMDDKNSLHTSKNNKDRTKNSQDTTEKKTQ
uniref:Uncharacterized protein n=1 Tax=Ditylenchus dipsaci TaxID=166011 RepID=A0A915D401_9BILA